MFDLSSEEARLLLNVALMATGQNRFRSAAKILAALGRFRPREASVASANAILFISMLDFKGAIDQCIQTFHQRMNFYLKVLH